MNINITDPIFHNEYKAMEHIFNSRWPDGEPICPRCGCAEAYHISTRRKFKCVACHHQFSVTSGTIFAMSSTSSSTRRSTA